MNDNPEKKKKQLIVPEKQTPDNGPENDVSLEQLESLCYSFSSRPRGCTTFTSVEEGDDVLF